MKVPELKDLLSQRGLPTTGKKTDLVDRLLQADASAEKDTLAESSLLSSAPLLEADAHAAGELELDASFAAKEGAFLEGLPAETGSPALNLDSSASSAKSPAFTLPAGTGAAEKAAAQSRASAAIKITQSMTEEERRALRKAKFGTKTDDEKKLDRARRFGLSVPELEEEKKRLRAERFGSAPAAKTSSIESLPVDKLEEERRRKRAERFGIVSEEDKKRKRAERFGVTTEEEKLAKRLQRFSSPTSGSASSPAPPVKVTGA